MLLRLPVVCWRWSWLCALSACSSTKTAGTQVDDAAITAKVKAKLAADGDINPFNIDVDTNEGVVTLQGTVEKEEARSKAEQHARETDGVSRVINLIKVGDKRSKPGRRFVFHSVYLQGRKPNEEGIRSPFAALSARPLVIPFAGCKKDGDEMDAETTPAVTEPMATEPMATEPMSTEPMATGTEPMGTEPMGTETTGTEPPAAQ